MKAVSLLFKDPQSEGSVLYSRTHSVKAVSLLFKDPQHEGSVLIIQGPTELRQCPYYSRTHRVKAVSLLFRPTE